MIPLVRNAVLLQVLCPVLLIHLLSHRVIGFYYAAMTAPFHLPLLPPGARARFPV